MRKKLSDTFSGFLISELDRYLAIHKELDIKRPFCGAEPIYFCKSKGGTGTRTVHKSRCGLQGEEEALNIWELYTSLP
jgi:hypothetical protein